MTQLGVECSFKGIHTSIHKFCLTTQLMSVCHPLIVNANIYVNANHGNEQNDAAYPYLIVPSVCLFHGCLEGNTHINHSVLIHSQCFVIISCPRQLSDHFNSMSLLI